MKKKLHFVFLLPVILFGCSFIGNANSIHGSFPLTDFDSIIFNAPGVLEITQGESASLEVLGSAELITAVRAQVNVRTLEISVASDIPSNASITYKLIVKNLSSVTLNNFSVIKIPALRADQFEMTINGLGRIELGKIEARNLVVRINGEGNLSVDSLVSVMTDISSTGAGNISIVGGRTDNLNLNLASGSFLGENFKSLSAAVKVDGTGTAFVWSVEKLDARINGAGHITYFGEPMLNLNMSGGGQVVSGAHQ